MEHPSLAELLEEIMDPSVTSEYHQEFINDVMAVKALNSKDLAKDDDTIKCNIWYGHADTDNKKELYYSAYIQYLGKTLFYHDQSQNDIAWDYYAQSRYYKGLFDAWDAVLGMVEAQHKYIVP